MSVPPTIFPIRTLRLSTRTFPPADATQSSSSAQTTSKDGRDGDLIGLAVPEECRRFPFTCCQDDAYRRAGCRKRGGPSSPDRLQSAPVCILVAQQRQHAADSLEERGACEVEKGRTGALVTESGATACTNTRTVGNRIIDLMD